MLLNRSSLWVCLARTSCATVVLILHSKRLSLIILCVVAAFVLAVGGTVLLRPRPAPEPSSPAASGADYRVKEVRLREEGKGGMRWELDAEQAEAFEQQGKTVLRGVTIRAEQPGGRRWTITSDEGEMLTATKDVELRGKVMLTSSDGLTLETPVLRWAAQDERAWTDAPVTLTRPGAVLTGRGLQVWMRQESAAVDGPVRATFTGVAPRPAVNGARR